MDKPIKREQPKTASVGYCNPPERTRFKKGRSGNPQGRPRGTFNMATVLERTLREKVVINENGKRKTITKLRSEEHTSELQSHLNLVCRLLLEKKKKKKRRIKRHYSN